MADYIPSPTQWVREHVEQYEATDGAEGYEMRGMPTVLVTHTGRQTGAVRKSPLMRVKHGETYVLVGSKGGAPEHPLWVHNLRAHAEITLRDKDQVLNMRVREVEDPAERAAMWQTAVAAFPDYATYQTRTERVIPLFACEPR